LETVVAARAGKPIPALPTIEPEIEGADLAGIYHGDRSDLTVEAADGRLTLIAGSERIALESMRVPAIPDAFVADHPDFALFPLRFGRDATGSVTELAHGGDWYATDHYEGARTFETPPEWAAYAGHYRSWNPWVSNFRIVVRKGELLQVSPSGKEETLYPEGDNFRVGNDPDSPERISFDTIVEGEALRARLIGGADYYRFFTP